uniref:Putative conserved secreted protein fat body overexpressed n=1 Tax=Rhipicephalus microplus TaxID=6941 RepID=A0A6M2D4Q8_RHIMP
MFRSLTVTLLLLSSIVLTIIVNSGWASFEGATGVCEPQPQSFGVGGRSTCTFSKIVDIDQHRIPPAIPTVKCKCPGNLCSSRGDFRCVDVKDPIQVSYRSSKSPTAFFNKTIDVTTSCVCAMSRSGSSKPSGLFRTEDNKWHNHNEAEDDDGRFE